MKINFCLNRLVRQIKSPDPHCSKDVDSLFCKKMWQDEFPDGKIKTFPYSKVTYHGRFNAFNHLLIKGGCPSDFNSPHPLLFNKTVKEIITESDVEFKRLKPTSQKLTVYRCIGEKPDFFAEYKIYLKKYNTKPGDVIYMPEYAYAASDTGYAKSFLSYKNGIVYEIEVPEGSRVSLTGKITDGKMSHGHECVFPRFSRFLCTAKSKDEKGHVYLKLKYIKPEEIF